MSRFDSLRVHNSSPYVPCNLDCDSKAIRLSNNENPYGPNEEMINKLIDYLRVTELNRYPDPEAKSFRKLLSRERNVLPEEIFLGNGSDEVLALIFMAFFNEKETVAIPNITYSFYRSYASFFGISIEDVPLNNDFSLPVDRFLNMGHKGILIANPNSPTGLMISENSIIDILETNPETLVIIDEAYWEFCGYSSVDLIHKYSNLLVVQTLSKSEALAGMRIGIAFGNEELIESLNKAKYSINAYTVNSLSLICSELVIKEKTLVLSNISHIIETRDKALNSLKDKGFFCLDSKTNFIFTKHQKYASEDVYSYLCKNNIFVRKVEIPNNDTYLRITVGTDKEMEVLLTVLDRMICDHG